MIKQTDLGYVVQTARGRVVCGPYETKSEAEREGRKAMSSIVDAYHARKAELERSRQIRRKNIIAATCVLVVLVFIAITYIMMK